MYSISVWYSATAVGYSGLSWALTGGLADRKATCGRGLQPSSRELGDNGSRIVTSDTLQLQPALARFQPEPWAASALPIEEA